MSTYQENYRSHEMFDIYCVTEKSWKMSRVFMTKISNIGPCLSLIQQSKYLFFSL